MHAKIGADTTENEPKVTKISTNFDPLRASRAVSNLVFLRFGQLDHELLNLFMLVHQLASWDSKPIQSDRGQGALTIRHPTTGLQGIDTKCASRTLVRELNSQFQKMSEMLSFLEKKPLPKMA